MNISRVSDVGINDEDGFVKQRDLRVGCELLMSTRARRNPIIFEAEVRLNAVVTFISPISELRLSPAVRHEPRGVTFRFDSDRLIDDRRQAPYPIVYYRYLGNFKTSTFLSMTGKW
jgi:hypothetical protein